MHRTVLLILVVSLSLAGCATPPTPYQPAGETRYGYAEEQIDADTWRVRFSGNAATDRPAVVDYVFYRAAEIALSQGADGFIVLREDIERDDSYYASPSPFPYYPHGAFFAGHGRRYSRYGYGVGYGAGAIRAEKRYTDHLRVRLFRDVAPEGLGEAYDARSILETFAPRIVRPQPPEN